MEIPNNQELFKNVIREVFYHQWDTAEEAGLTDDEIISRIR